MCERDNCINIAYDTLNICKYHHDIDSLINNSNENDNDVLDKIDINDFNFKCHSGDILNLFDLQKFNTYINEIRSDTRKHEIAMVYISAINDIVNNDKNVKFKKMKEIRGAIKLSLLPDVFMAKPYRLSDNVTNKRNKAHRIDLWHKQEWKKLFDHINFERLKKKARVDKAINKNKSNNKKNNNKNNNKNYPINNNTYSIINNEIIEINNDNNNNNTNTSDDIDVNTDNVDIDMNDVIPEMMMMIQELVV
jgi:hypothetical protein